MSDQEIPKTRDAARASNAKHFRTGIPCKRGHVALRYTSTGGCSMCLNAHARKRHRRGLKGELPERVCPKCGTTHSRRACLQCLSDRKYKSYLENTQFLREYKSSHPCTDCKRFFSWVVMEFDHRDGRQSRLELIAYRVHRSRAKLMEEMAKCDLVCANCHRVRTYDRDMLEGRRRTTDPDPEPPGKKTGLPVR